MIDEKLMKKIDRTYFHIKDRCYNKRGEYYHLYGGRGIIMCDEWFKNKQSFIDWSINNGVAIGLSINRIDCDGNYSPENCRWVDMKVQNNNRRNNIKVEYKGKTYSIIELSELLGIKYRTLVARLKERVNKKSRLNERYIYKNGKYYMVAIHRKYIGQTKTLKEAIALRDKKLKELEGEDE